ncbi:YibE/F family protein [Clostridium butyricum]|uniref:YibE/F family protein n=2 Tax=Clostridiaceae TaxID=31979 RepID=C4IHG2_CLOBU|nr:YibE/F family protein [Clostridium butyricum]APF24335.1 yibE/F-like family protein [Clostridium butyricum]EDT75590.1 putative membrane protein [Clostridium butyricum 5521]EEP53842.1 YibE/F family protein [Clostridium butyricum E4 str. BoNT E BL5262]NFL30303.1 YibE/F family protein [Clostridium butyricum]NFS17595.1 YibE/F family protein [Clostridium butyricum]
MLKDIHRRNTIPILITLIAIVVLICVPNKFPQKIYENTERVSARVLSTDESFIINNGLIKTGEQLCEVEILQGKFKGETVTGSNRLSGSLEQDKIFAVGDKILVTLDYTGDEIRVATLVDHYRINYEILLVGVFMIFLVGFSGIVGIKAILSFIFTILAMWKLLIPLFLMGYNPILIGMVTTIILVCLIIGLVYGIDRRSLAGIIGALAGSIVTCFMALFFVSRFKIHGAVMSYSEMLLYSGYENLNLTEIFIASIFIASSGAVMDVAVDITSAVAEVVEKKPDITRTEAIKSGINVGRSIMGTMMTTLLLAYSGGYIGLLMVFMAQGTPIINILNLKYVSSEILHTLVGSFGLITVAPFTAVASGILLAERNVQ